MKGVMGTVGAGSVLPLMRLKSGKEACKEGQAERSSRGGSQGNCSALLDLRAIFACCNPFKWGQTQQYISWTQQPYDSVSDNTSHWSPVTGH